MKTASDIVAMSLPRTLVFGRGCSAQAVDYARRSTLIVTSHATRDPCRRAVEKGRGIFTVWEQPNREPTVTDALACLAAGREAKADAVLGIGGGSAMDVAKVVAALIPSNQQIPAIFGTGQIAQRGVYCACLPTTAGTGSEVSPNSILLDETSGQKKGIISPHLVPDAALVDPELTLTVPPAITAATGIDALTHCIEAYANRFAHPMIDLYALEGIRRISGSLRRAVENGADLAARTDVALGSMYGGMCLGPVNTGAVHALAYPLQSQFKIAHGVANAVLLPWVLEFNLPAAPQRYAQVAAAMGAADLLQSIRQLSRDCGVPQRLGEIGIGEAAIAAMADSAMTVTRLLERNVRPLSLDDAMTIYRKAL